VVYCKGVFYTSETFYSINSMQLVDFERVMSIEKLNNSVLYVSRKAI